MQNNMNQLNQLNQLNQQKIVIPNLLSLTQGLHEEIINYNLLLSKLNNTFSHISVIFIENNELKDITENQDVITSLKILYNNLINNNKLLEHTINNMNVAVGID